MTDRARWRWAAALVCLGFVALALLYGASTPVLEASDELHHYPVVQHIAAGRGLPVQPGGPDDRFRQEGSQPPLYYLIGAAATAWIDQSDFARLDYPNPHARVGDPLAPDNKNMFSYDPALDVTNNGALRAAWIVRLLTIALGVGCLLCTFAIVRTLLPERPWLAIAAMAFQGLIPTFLFVSASVNNDTAITLAASLVILLSLRLLRSADDDPARAPWLLVAGVGVAFGAAALTKVSGLGLAAPIGLALGVAAWRRSGGSAPATARLLLPQLAVIGGLALAIAGWWYLRNLLLYGELLGIETMLDVAGRRDIPFNLETLLAEFQGFRISFWGLFGGSNLIVISDPLYQWLDRFTALALAGLVAIGGVAVVRRRLADWAAWAVLVLWVLVIGLALLRWTSVTPASFGRLVFPALAPLVILGLAGLTGWLPRRVAPLAATAACLALAAFALTAPLLAIRPAYAIPAPISLDAIPEDAVRLDYTYGDVARLLAVRVERDAIAPGEPLPVTLYWQPLRAVDRDYSVYIHANTRDGSAGQRDSYPGGGLLPTSRWSPGTIVADRHWLPTWRDTPGPDAALLVAGLYELAGFRRLPVTGPDGATVGLPALGRVRIEGDRPAPGDGARIGVRFGPAISLERAAFPALVHPGGELPVDLVWQAGMTPPADYTVFVHLLAADGRLVAQRDAPPRAAQFPTSLWRAGDEIGDRWTLRLPGGLLAGDYSLIAGLYDPRTGLRLTVEDGPGAGGTHAELGRIEVAP